MSSNLDNSSISGSKRFKSNEKAPSARPSAVQNSKKTNSSKKRSIARLTPVKSIETTKLEQQVRFLNTILHKTDPTASNSADSELKFSTVQLLNFVNVYFNVFRKFSPQSDNNNNNEPLLLDSGEPVSVCFPCTACSAKFTLEQTFQQHLNRRSILIRVFCTKCNASKTFFNKCKFLYHIYSHKSDLLEPIYKWLQIDELPREKAHLNRDLSVIDFHAWLANNIRQETLNKKQNIQSSSVLNNTLNHLYSRLCDRDMKEIKRFVYCVLQNKFLVYKCYLCDALFLSANELKLHYTQTFAYEINLLKNTNQHFEVRSYFSLLKQNYLRQSVPKILDTAESKQNTKHFSALLNKFSCKKLGFSTRCSYLASINLIKCRAVESILSNEPLINLELNNVMPLICPLCGLSFDPANQFDNFKMHFIYQCQLFAHFDFDFYKCPQLDCSTYCESLRDFVAHWTQKHVLKKHQCELCLSQASKTHVFHELGGPTQTKQSDLFFNILSENNSTCYNASRLCSTKLLSEINNHYVEHHSNRKVALKLVYKCSCKDLMLANESNELDCVLNDLKSCNEHASQIARQYANEIRCLLCDAAICRENYQKHMIEVHKREKDAFFVCPICGLVNKNEANNLDLHSHIMSAHKKLNLSEFSSSSFHNLVTTHKKSIFEKNARSALVDKKAFLSDLLPDELFAYFCLTCRLFFSTDSNFSHNCGNITENSKSLHQINAQSNNSSNYFSPIFVQLNLKQFLLNGKNADAHSSQTTTE